MNLVFQMPRLERHLAFSRGSIHDVAALMGLQVRDVLSDRKYHGSYESVVQALKMLNLGASDIREFFSQLALSIMVRNGDAHLKNFGVLYTSPEDVRLSPMFDVVTTNIYKYQKHANGPELQDNTMALKLRRGARGKGYPTTAELCDFATQVCGVVRPQDVLARIAEGMVQALQQARTDSRISPELLAKMAESWEYGMRYARESQVLKGAVRPLARPPRDDGPSP